MAGTTLKEPTVLSFRSMRWTQVGQQAKERNMLEDVVYGHCGGQQEQSGRQVHQQPPSDRQATGRGRPERLQPLRHRLWGGECGDVRHGGQLGDP